LVFSAWYLVFDLSAVRYSRRPHKTPNTKNQTPVQKKYNTGNHPGKSKTTGNRAGFLEAAVDPKKRAAQMRCSLDG
jgi:hypothetical protein